MWWEETVKLFQHEVFIKYFIIIIDKSILCLVRFSSIVSGKISDIIIHSNWILPNISKLQIIRTLQSFYYSLLFCNHSTKTYVIIISFLRSYFLFQQGFRILFLSPEIPRTDIFPQSLGQMLFWILHNPLSHCYWGNISVRGISGDRKRIRKSCWKRK